MSQYFTKVSAEDLKNNLTAYIQAAKEGKLYLCSSSPNRSMSHTQNHLKVL